MNKYRSKIKNSIALVAVSLSSWFGGSLYEKHKGLNFMNILAQENLILGNPNNRTTEIMQHGYPSMGDLRSYDDFVLSYDHRNKIPHWVFEHLTVEKLRVTENVDRSKCEFVEDISVHPYFRAKNEDYLKSGFDRGHLAAAGNHRLSQRHCDQTFFLSNIAPQVGVGFNRDKWNKLEKYVRKLTKTNKNVYVCTGPLFLPILEPNGKKYIKYQVIGKSNVAVPTHFFKVIVIESTNNKFYLEAYLMPNQPISDSEPLSNFQVSPQTIELNSGLLFFDKISNRLEKINGKSIK